MNPEHKRAYSTVGRHIHRIVTIMANHIIGIMCMVGSLAIYKQEVLSGLHTYTAFPLIFFWRFYANLINDLLKFYFT